MEYGFYQVNGSTPSGVEAVLPLLLQKTIERGQRAVVLVSGQAHLQRLDESLWTFDPTSFLPHGAAGEEGEAAQPVLLTQDIEASRANNAEVLIALGGTLDDVGSDKIAAFSKIADVFDAGEAQVKRARARWKKIKENSIEPSYFAHDGRGWQKKA